MSTIIAEDADCDGVLTTDDCNDDDPTTVDDMDCDGTSVDEDCDDSDPYSLSKLSMKNVMASSTMCLCLSVESIIAPSMPINKSSAGGNSVENPHHLSVHLRLCARLFHTCAINTDDG